MVAAPAGPDGRVAIRPLESTEDFRLRRQLAEAIEQALRSLGLPVFTALQLNQVVALLPADERTSRLREHVSALHAILRAQAPQPSTVLAVGRPQPHHAQLRRSLEEAQAVLTLARGPGVWWYEDAVVL
ncbi:MAG: hypothetical protein C4303_04395, partial [candidate division GAL15 bacterium]